MKLILTFVDEKKERFISPRLFLNRHFINQPITLYFFTHFLLNNINVRAYINI